MNQKQEFRKPWAQTNLNINKEEHSEEVNILLLGETGVGKSTFINAFVNYLAFSTLDEAIAGELISLIPTKFTISNDNFEAKVIQFGDSSNESKLPGQSATQGAKSYVFSLNGMKIRLIDTPGMGDTRGIDHDNKNFENLLQYISEFKELHAVCILLKPNNARVTTLFEYCVKQLLSRLEKTASKNIIFLFTNSRGTFYKPGDTLPALQVILAQIASHPPFVQIPFEKKNVFCIDNEAFRFLLAVRDNFEFSQTETNEFRNSWKTSSEKCLSMLMYITGGGINCLTPHRVQNTLSVNEARRLIRQIAKPMTDIGQMIQNNLTVLKRQKDFLDENKHNLSQLKSKLYVPVINVKRTDHDEPITVCSSVKCREIYSVEGVNVEHYKQRCHNPCFLDTVPKDLIGPRELLECWAMNELGNCIVCGCSYGEHMHIYYETETFSDNIVDQTVRSKITTEEEGTQKALKIIEEIEERSKEYEEERAIILKLTAKFAHFLQTSAISPYNDVYQRYIQYLIANEESLGAYSDRGRIKYLNDMLNQYEEEKHILDEGLKLAQKEDYSRTSIVTAEDVVNSVKMLYSLKHSGGAIKDFCEGQARVRQNERKTECEYVHQTPYQNNYLTKLINFAIGKHI